jgi:hypothetical protein
MQFLFEKKRKNLIVIDLFTEINKRFDIVIKKIYIFSTFDINKIVKLKLAFLFSGTFKMYLDSVCHILEIRF